MLRRPRARSWRSALDELVAEGARRMLAAALEAEVDAYVSSLVDEVDEHGHRLVVRNGHAEPRSLVTGAGPIEVRAPRVDDRRVDEETGERMRFRSSILPPWARKSPKVAEVLPLMYLHGMSSGDFAPALEEFFGSAAGLSASVITRLDDRVAARTGPVRPPLPDRRRLRLHLGRRDPLQRPPRRGPPVCPGHRGRARRRDQGAGLDHRRAPRVHRVLGRRAARPQAPGHDAPRCSPSATGPSGSGGRSARSSPRPRTSGAGCTRWPTS